LHLKKGKIEGEIGFFDCLSYNLMDFDHFTSSHDDISRHSKYHK